MNTTGTLFRLTTYGESHGVAVGGIIDGMPAGIEIDLEFLAREMARRRPGQSAITTGRQEADQVEILSGVFEGKTTGTPIGFEVRNSNQHSADYDNVRHVFRPSHADYTYTEKYGLRDHRGGGRSSARETLARVVGGAFAKMALRQLGIEVMACTSQVGDLTMPLDVTERFIAGLVPMADVEANAVRCPDAPTAQRMEALIKQVKAEGDTIGGVVTCVITGVPAGLGDPAFGKLHARLGAAMLSINACKGFDYGLGFADCGRRGSQMLDAFTVSDGKVGTQTNHSGGIQGGISNGMPIYFRCAFKPVATLLQAIDTINDQLEPAQLEVRGRHDPCVLPRAVPIVEAMAAMTVLDSYLLNKTIHL